MEASYWESRWRQNKIGFHMDTVNPRLIHFRELIEQINPGKVLIPLCGKSHDIIWFAEHGWQVHGVELVEKAVLDFFQEQQLEPHKSKNSVFEVYSVANISLWRGDWFRFTPKLADDFSLIYDRAALVAIPPEKRNAYTTQLKKFIKAETYLLLHTFEYDQQEMNGPPFSVPKTEVLQHFDSTYEVIELLREDMTPHLERFQQRGAQKIIEVFYSIRLKK